MLGRCKWFSNKRGYGFIFAENGTDYFCHFSNLTNDFKNQDSGYASLRENEPVEFDVIQGEKGAMAANVRRVKKVS